MTPAAKSRPKEATKSSAISSPIPSSMKSMPTQLKGRIWRAKPSSTKAATPIAPGTIRPGLWNSM